MKGSPFILFQAGEGGDWYVKDAPDIRFTQNPDDAKRFNQPEALATLDTLMTMQRTSSGSDAAVFSVKCIKQH